MNKISLAALRAVHFAAYYTMWWGAVTGLAYLAIAVPMMLHSRPNFESPLFGFVGISIGLLLFVPVARRALQDRYLHRYLLGIGIGGLIASILLGIHFYRVSKALTGIVLFGGLQELILAVVCFIFGVFFVVTAAAGAAGLGLGLELKTPPDQPPASSYILLKTGALAGLLIGAAVLIIVFKARQSHAREAERFQASQQAYALAHPKPPPQMVAPGYASNCYDGTCSWFDAVDYCREKRGGLPGVKELRAMVRADCGSGAPAEYAWSKIVRGDLALTVDLCSGKTREEFRIYGSNRVRCVPAGGQAAYKHGKQKN